MVGSKNILVEYKGNVVQMCARFSTAANCVRRTVDKRGGKLSDVKVKWCDWKRHELSGEKFLELVDSGNIPMKSNMKFRVMSFEAEAQVFNATAEWI